VTSEHVTRLNPIAVLMSRESHRKPDDTAPGPTVVSYNNLKGVCPPWDESRVVRVRVTPMRRQGEAVG
jgi:hypothetical protein